MNQHEKIRIFELIAESNIANKYNINRGGCGCFAELMREYFPDLKILYCDRYGCAMREYEDNTPTAPHHVVLSDDEFYYDARGVHEIVVYESEHDYDTYFEVEPDYLSRCLCDTGVWNSMFYRGDLPTIKSKVNQFINTVTLINKHNESTSISQGSARQ